MLSRALDDDIWLRQPHPTETLPSASKTHSSELELAAAELELLGFTLEHMHDLLLKRLRDVFLGLKIEAVTDRGQLVIDDYVLGLERAMSGTVRIRAWVDPAMTLRVDVEVLDKHEALVVGSGVFGFNPE